MDTFYQAVLPTGVSDWRMSIHRKLCYCSNSTCYVVYFIKRKRYQADGAVTKVAAFRLPKQLLIMQLSRSFLTCLFMLRPMLSLAFDAAVSNEIASGAFL